MFLLYYRDFFEQICSDVQFISPPEEVGEFLLHLLKMQNEMKLTDESWISYQQGKGNEDTIAQFFSDDESRLDLTKEQKEILEIWDGLDEKEREIFMTFIRSLKK